MFFPVGGKLGSMQAPSRKGEENEETESTMPHPPLQHGTMKLGRKAIKTDSRTLKLGKYTKGLPPVPPKVDWTKGITEWGMMLNRDLHDCTIAGLGHAIQVWSANTTGEVTIPDDVILSYYEKWDGYNPADPTSDKGGAELTVMNLWKKSEFAGHKLLAFADLAVGNLDEIRQAILLFGGVYVGVNLPNTASPQIVAGQPWDVVTPASADTVVGSWGGHGVFVPAYDQDGFTCITWGVLQKMTPAFWHAYVDEAHVMLSADWLEKHGSPAGFDLAQLKADLAKIH